MMPEWITKYWIEWVFGLLIAGLGWIVKTLSKRLKVQQAENKALRDGVKSLLVIDGTDEATGTAIIRPASWIVQAAEKAKNG